MTFNERIDGSQAVDWIAVRPFSEYYFEIEDPNTSDPYEYTVLFDQDGDILDVVFKVAQGEGIQSTHDQISVGFGNAIKVFHTVWGIIKEFLNTSEDPISVIEFESKNSEPSRVKFYKVLAKQLAIEHGYSPDSVIIEDSRYTPDTTYFAVPVSV